MDSPNLDSFDRGAQGDCVYPLLKATLLPADYMTDMVRASCLEGIWAVHLTSAICWEWLSVVSGGSSSFTWVSPPVWGCQCRRTLRQCRAILKCILCSSLQGFWQYWVVAVHRYDMFCQKHFIGFPFPLPSPPSFFHLAFPRSPK